MLKRIEITDFESHKHTVIDCLSEGLNLFRGESNAGKTSIVRALKLAAYNDFDPKSVRTGETKCEVIVETDKGTVKVVRGPKVNFWEVTPLGQTPLTFDKVGRNIVPEAARVMGLNIVRLGDADIPVNIMDQLESHFMLASMGGQDATGSLRAQVIDEISGLSGIEGVIKAVSLDNHRFGREIKETEEKMEEAQSQMHNEQELLKEKSILELVENTLAEYDEIVRLNQEAQVLLDNHTKISQQVETSQCILDAMPDVDMVKTCLDTSKSFKDKADQAKSIHETAINTGQKVYDAEESIESIPSVAEALTHLSESEHSIEAAQRMENLLSDYRKTAQKTDEANAKLEGLQIGDPTVSLGVAQAALQGIKEMEGMLSGVGAIQKRIGVSEGSLRANEQALKKAVAERDAILAQIKVCPLTLKPVSQQCLEEAK